MEGNILRKVTRKFNQYRYPECKAKVVSHKERRLKVEFSGTKASFACCFDENFVDYKYYLKDLANLDFEIERIERKTPETFIVNYYLQEVKHG
ncbi:MAG: hypothetical protein NC821_04360 [Candidatus Omnitrophica bacterium]|nr:hypothetical protein [Candidatus Omnitrophota bacterium]